MLVSGYYAKDILFLALTNEILRKMAKFLVPVYPGQAVSRNGIRTSVLAGALGMFGYVANVQRNTAVLAVIKHSFATMPGILWIVPAIVLYFYRLKLRRNIIRS